MDAQERAERIFAEYQADYWGGDKEMIARIVLALQEAEAEGARREREACALIVLRERDRLKSARMSPYTSEAEMSCDFIAESIRSLNETPARPDAGKKE